MLITIIELIRRLRKNGLALNFIEANHTLQINEPGINGNLEKFLDAGFWDTKGYWLTNINERHIIYPKDPIWNSRVSGISIQNTPRIDAVYSYLKELGNQISALQISPPLIKGDPAAPIYTELVSVDPEASVLNHFVQLSGKNKAIVFTIEHFSNDAPPIMHFEELSL